jgi:hypothetical protein
MDCRVLESNEYKEFLRLCKAVKRYYKSDMWPPDSLLRKYDEAKSNYCGMLDNIDLKMPRAKFYFNPKDNSTHKYLSIEAEKKIKDKSQLKFQRIVFNGKSIKIYFNPDFKY